MTLEETARLKRCEDAIRKVVESYDAIKASGYAPAWGVTINTDVIKEFREAIAPPEPPRLTASEVAEMDHWTSFFSGPVSRKQHIRYKWLGAKLGGRP